MVARLPLGVCSSGLNFGLRSSVFLVGHFLGRPSRSLPRPSGLNAVGVSPFSCVLRFSVMALCAFRRTVSLDVSQLAGSNTYIHT